MKELILNNVFLDVEDSNFDITIHEIGNTSRSFSVAIHTDYTNKYISWDIALEGLSPSMHSNLLYLVSLNRGYDGEAEDLTLTDDKGEIYNVTIPLNGYSYSEEEGDLERYSWEIELQEVL